MKTFNGLEYQTWENPITGTWCGYVKLPENHPFIETLKETHKEELFDGKIIDVNNFKGLKVKCHGKLSFGKLYENDTPRFTKGWWIGWDYGHKGDFAPRLKLKKGMKERFYSEKEVITECKAVIKQVIDALNVC